MLRFSSDEIWSDDRLIPRESLGFLEDCHELSHRNFPFDTWELMTYKEILLDDYLVDEFDEEFWQLV